MVSSSNQGVGRLTRAFGIVESINEWVGRIVAYSLYGLFGVMLYDVIARYAFNAPTQFAFELTLFIWAYACLLGGGYVLLHKAHVNVDVFYSRLPLRGRAIIDICTAPILFIFVGVLLWQGWAVFWNSFSFLEHSTVSRWNPPIYPVKIALPIGAGLVLLQALVKLIKDILIAVRGRI
jgi:TRAP-type mannitol/chloroaromatic compound transport system permease small subunit